MREAHFSLIQMWGEKWPQSWRRKKKMASAQGKNRKKVEKNEILPRECTTNDTSCVTFITNSSFKMVCFPQALPDSFDHGSDVMKCKNALFLFSPPFLFMHSCPFLPHNDIPPPTFYLLAINIYQKHHKTPSINTWIEIWYVYGQFHHPPRVTLCVHCNLKTTSHQAIAQPWRLGKLGII